MVAGRALSGARPAPNLVPVMRHAPALILLLAAACAPVEAPPPDTAALEGPDSSGTFVTDYGGGTAPVSRFVRLPDGTSVPLRPGGYQHFIPQKGK